MGTLNLQSESAPELSCWSVFESRLGDGLPVGRTRSARSAVEHCGDLAGDLFGGHADSLVDVDLVLRHPARGMAEQGRNGEF